MFIISFFIYSCDKQEPSINKIEMPATNGNQIIEHLAYTLSYNETHEQADWVAYYLTKEEAVSDSFSRKDDFREDPEVSTGSSALSDYKDTGYDRGHLCPAADNHWSKDAMSESFYMSNMSPQNQSFNRGKWSYLEKEVRHWAEIYDGVYVVVGGVLKDDLPTIGDNKVSIPNYFYKVILDYNGKKAIGFIMPNIPIEDSFKNYSVSVDSVESFTGLDFFINLPDDEEENIESNFNISQWDFKYY